MKSVERLIDAIIARRAGVLRDLAAADSQQAPQATSERDAG